MYKILGGDGREYGPVSADMIRQWITEGRANAQTRVLPEGATEWKLLGGVPEFMGALGTLFAPPAVPGPIVAPTIAPRNNPLAIAGLVLGIVSLPFGFCCMCYGLPFNIVGLVLSIVALVQINREPQIERGTPMAIVGVVLSVFSIIATFVMKAVGVAILSTDWMQKLQGP
jgi:hypothetical protein